jgi:hypothetical protein
MDRLNFGSHLAEIFLFDLVDLNPKQRRVTTDSNADHATNNGATYETSGDSQQ